MVQKDHILSKWTKISNQPVNFLLKIIQQNKPAKRSTASPATFDKWDKVPDFRRRRFFRTPSSGGFPGTTADRIFAGSR